MTTERQQPEEEREGAAPPGAENPDREALQSTWVNVLGRVMERWVPDALTTAIGLMVVLIALSLTIGGTVSETLNAYYEGLWNFLRFTMQMTLIMVLSLIVTATPLFKNMVVRISRLPKTRVQVVTLAALCAGGLAYLNWGVSLALGPVIAIHFCREAERKGIQVDFLFLLAVLAGAGSIWQFGLSASAPLIMATPGQVIVPDMAIMPLRSTIWTVASIVHVLTFLLATIMAGCWLMPRRVRPISEFPDSMKVADMAGTSGEAGRSVGTTLTPAKRLEHSSLVLMPLAIMLGGWLYVHFLDKRLSVDINSVNTTLLLLGIVLHRNVANFQSALRDAIKLSWPVVVLYHLYAGVAGLIQFTPVGEFLVSVIAPLSTPYTFPLLITIISTVVAIFIPTSGGQWAIQGSVTSAAAQAVGVTAQRGLLALSVDINAVNTTLLLAAIVLHRNVANFQHALRDAIKLSWPVVVLYHLYAGVAGLIQFTPVGEFLVSLVAPISTPYTYPLLIAVISSVVAIFIPTSGGQWAIQGSVTTSLAEAVGVTAQRGLLALSVGDHMGNLLTPFWAVVGANIARVDFRLYFGYRLIFAALWFGIGVLCFTFLPC